MNLLHSCLACHILATLKKGAPKEVEKANQLRLTTTTKIIKTKLNSTPKNSSFEGITY